MTIRVAAIEVSHWHALYDAAYLRHLVAMPDVELVAIQDSDAGLVAKRAAEVGSPPTFTDYRKMLATTRPDFVLALGRHRQMAGIAHDLLDQGCPFLMEKPRLDMFLHLTGEEAQVTGAQLSHRAHEHPVEDYASVILRSASGILGTVEVGNGFPRDGTDGEWKIAGRDAILTMKDGIMKLATADGDETLPGANVTAPVFATVRHALDHWRRGAAPPISVHDCARVVRLIDQAYERAG
jgi:predicted dehydrogenase